MSERFWKFISIVCVVVQCILAGGSRADVFDLMLAELQAQTPFLDSLQEYVAGPIASSMYFGTGGIYSPGTGSMWQASLDQVAKVQALIDGLDFNGDPNTLRGHIETMLTDTGQLVTLMEQGFLLPGFGYNGDPDTLHGDVAVLVASLNTVAAKITLIQQAIGVSGGISTIIFDLDQMVSKLTTLQTTLSTFSGNFSSFRNEFGYGPAESVFYNDVQLLLGYSNSMSASAASLVGLFDVGGVYDLRDAAMLSNLGTMLSGLGYNGDPGTLAADMATLIAAVGNLPGDLGVEPPFVGDVHNPTPLDPSTVMTSNLPYSAVMDQAWTPLAGVTFVEPVYTGAPVWAVSIPEWTLLGTIMPELAWSVDFTSIAPLRDIVRPIMQSLIVLAGMLHVWSELRKQ